MPITAPLPALPPLLVLPLVPPLALVPPDPAAASVAASFREVPPHAVSITTANHAPRIHPG